MEGPVSNPALDRMEQLWEGVMFFLFSHMKGPLFGFRPGPQGIPLLRAPIILYIFSSLRALGSRFAKNINL